MPYFCTSVCLQILQWYCECSHTIIHGMTQTANTPMIENTTTCFNIFTAKNIFLGLVQQLKKKKGKQR